MRKLSILPLILLFALLSACSSGESNNVDSSESIEPEISSMTGKKVYDTYCVACHGADGKMAFSGATDLSQSTLDIETRVLQITNGKGVMNAFKGIITEEEIQNVAVYIEELRVE